MDFTAVVDFLTVPYNIPFLFALALASLFGLLQVFLGVLPDGIDLDLDGDGELDFDADVDVDVELDGDGQFAHDLGMQLLGWMGVGKIPISVLVTQFLFVFSILGLSLSGVLGQAFAVPFVGTAGGWVWFGVCFLVSLRLNSLLANLVAKVLPKDSTTADGGDGDVSRTALTVTDVNEFGGQAELAGGRYVFVYARPEDDIIPKGAQVMLIEYDRKLNQYLIEKI